MRFFCLKHSEFESTQSCYYYSGADISQREFKFLCDSLLPDAAKRCLAKQLESHEPYSVYWADILEELDLMLVDRGFEKLEFAEAEYFGWGIGTASNDLLGAHVVKAIERFNKQREDEFHAEIERCRFSS